MIPTDLIVEVRDKDLARVGQIMAKDLTLTADLGDPTVAKGPGKWTLRLPGEHWLAPYLLTPGSGLIVTHAPTGTVLFSGPTEVPTDERTPLDLQGTLTLTGTTDDVLLWRRRAYPTPTAAATAQVDAYDVRSGVGETVMRAYVEANLGAGAPADRQVAMLTLAADGGRGGAVKASARFDLLGDLLASLGLAAGLRWRVVQIAATLQFQVYEPQDRSATVRLSLSAGSLSSQRTETSAPGLTHALVLGQGVGADRTVVERTTADAAAAIAAWGPWARSEGVQDQRNTDDPDELAQAGDKALTEAAGGTAVHLIPSDDQTMAWPDAWNVGDLVGVETGGVPATIPVTSVALRVSSAGVKVGAGVGDPPSLDPLAAVKSSQADTDRRVEALERTIDTAVAVGEPVRADGATVNNISATAWAALPTDLTLDVTVAARTVVDVRMGVWMNKSGTNDLRVGFRATGATTYNENDPSWGAVLWRRETAADAQGFVAKGLTLEPGTTTFQVRAYITGSTTETTQVNYPYLEVVPLHLA